MDASGGPPLPGGPSTPLPALGPVGGAAWTGEGVPPAGQPSAPCHTAHHPPGQARCAGRLRRAWRAAVRAAHRECRPTGGTPSPRPPPEVRTRGRSAGCAGRTAAPSTTTTRRTRTRAITADQTTRDPRDDEHQDDEHPPATARRAPRPPTIPHTDASRPDGPQTPTRCNEIRREPPRHDCPLISPMPQLSGRSVSEIPGVLRR